MKTVFKPSCVAVAIAALAVFAGCHRAQLALVDHPRDFPDSVSKDETFYSSALDRNMTYRVYLPQNVSAGKRLPAIYLLHGCGTSFRDWSNYSDVGAYAAKGFILVMVDGACSYYANAALNSKDKYEDYFVHDLIADAESRFPVMGNRDNRAIVGVSMGGFAAVKLALTRPDLFSFAGASVPPSTRPAVVSVQEGGRRAYASEPSSVPREVKRACTAIRSSWSSPQAQAIRHSSTSLQGNRNRFSLQFDDL